MNRIKALRESAKLTQEQLAEQVKVSQQAVGKWETGAAMPRADKLPELARVLGCTIADLYGSEQKGA